jgi:hypothetical protein
MASSHDRGTSLAERLYAAALWMLPTSFRREYGPLMAQLLRDQFRDARRSGTRFAVMRVLLRAGPDLVATAAREHAHAVARMPPRWRFGLPAIAVLGLLVAVGPTALSIAAVDLAEKAQKLDHAPWRVAASERARAAGRNLAASGEARAQAVAALLVRHGDDIARGVHMPIEDPDGRPSPLPEAEALMRQALAAGMDDPVVLAIATWHCPVDPAICRSREAQARWRQIDPRNALAWWPRADDPAPDGALDAMAASTHATDPAWIARRIAHRALAAVREPDWPTLDALLPSVQATAWMLARDGFETQRTRRLGPTCLEAAHDAIAGGRHDRCVRASTVLLETATTYRDRFVALAVLRKLGDEDPAELEAIASASEARVARANDLETRALQKDGALQYPFGPAELAELLQLTTEKAFVDGLLSRHGLALAQQH